MRSPGAGIIRLVVTTVLMLCTARAASGTPVADAVARTIRGTAPRPRLVVLLSIDQLRADYLARYGDLFLPATSASGAPGGFQYLTTSGAWFVDARYRHLPLFTGPGHAILSSGAYPDKSGIIGNEWWDPVARTPVYCVGDPRWQVVGAAPDSKARPMGPANLRTSTVGDELKLATAGRARVVTLAMKDRAAILMGGHAQDLSIWFDETGGRWISSTAFCRDGHLPAWVEAINREGIPGRALGSTWTASVAEGVLAQRAFEPILSSASGTGMEHTFPHTIGREATVSNYRLFTLTPEANAFVFETARRAVAAESLGQDDIPDILAIGLSTNDYVGHAFGPYSPEVLDLTVRTDRQLAEFIGYLDHTVPGGLNRVVFAVTADHGVAPNPGDASSPRFDLRAGWFDAEAITGTIARALTARFGAPAGGSWYSRSATDTSVSGAYVEGNVYFDPGAVNGAVRSGKARNRRDIEDAASDAVNDARIPGVYACYGRSRIEEGALPANELGAQLSRAIYPSISGDLVVIGEQMFLEGKPGPRTSHGTPYAYDTHVPLIVLAPGRLRPGVYVEPVSPADLAPTLSLLLGIEFPSGCDGQPLGAALAP